MKEPVWIGEREALAVPRQLHACGDVVDPGLLAAACTFRIGRNHPFIDGNKRTGFVVGVLFLELNGRLFQADEEEAAHAVPELAAGTLDEAGYAAFLRTRSVGLGAIC